MSDPLEGKTARTVRTPEAIEVSSDQMADEILKRIKDAQAEQEHLTWDALAADLKTLRQALKLVRDIASEAVAEAAPGRAIMVVKEIADGDIIAACPVSEAVASNDQKTNAIRQLSRELCVSVDFVRVHRNTLTSAEACKRFLRHLNGEEDVPSRPEI